MSDVTEQNSESQNQFVTFRSGEQEFGADIMAIREIRGWTPTTPLPHAPNYVRGVINLRGISPKALSITRLPSTLLRENTRSSSS